MSILPKWVHPYVREQKLNKYIFRRVLSPTPGWFLLGPLEFKINDSAWQRAQKSTTGECKSDGNCIIWLTKWRNRWWDQNISKAFKFLCSATTSVVSCQNKNSSYIILNEKCWQVTYEMLCESYILLLEPLHKEGQLLILLHPNLRRGSPLTASWHWQLRWTTHSVTLFREATLHFFLSPMIFGVIEIHCPLSGSLRWCNISFFFFK